MKNTILDIQSICKQYDNKKILDNISFAMHKGEVLSLLGINGAGKSTLTNIITMLKKPTSGDIIYNNKSIYQQTNIFKNSIGYTPQMPNLNSNFTMYDNLKLAGKCFNLSNKAIQENIQYYEKQFELTKYLSYYDYELSGGWKQIFMITRSLLHNPKIVILDEPTVGLDVNIRKTIWEIIKILKNNKKTILLTTHYLEEAEKLSDRVCFLKQGKIELIDAPKTLLEKYSCDTLENVFLKFLKEDKFISCQEK